MDTPSPNQNNDFARSIRCGVRDRDGPPDKRRGRPLARPTPEKVHKTAADNRNIDGQAQRSKRRLELRAAICAGDFSEKTILEYNQTADKLPRREDPVLLLDGRNPHTPRGMTPATRERGSCSFVQGGLPGRRPDALAQAGGSQALLAQGQA
jgi:hypothetical protein